MSDCPYCRGTGTQYVESGSSLCYDCPDCGGTGSTPTCDCCGNDYYGEYCEDCYTVCPSCRVIRPWTDIGETSGICADCEWCADDARHILNEHGVSSYNLTAVDLADIVNAASWEVSQYCKNNKPVNFDREARLSRNIYDLAVSAQYNCPAHETIKCGFCGELGIRVNYLGTEVDSDGRFENWNAECTHCGKKSVDMNDPDSAVDIIVRGDRGDVVNAD